MKTFLQLARDLMKPGEEIAALLTADEADLWHGATGVAGEAGELLDAIKKHVVYKKPLDRENVVEELADLRFYMAALMNRLNITEVEMTEVINAKLAKRYASGSYSNEQAQARADKAEEQFGREAGDALADEDDFAEAFDAKLAQMGEGLRTEAEMQADDEARAAADDV